MSTHLADCKAVVPLFLSRLILVKNSVDGMYLTLIKNMYPCQSLIPFDITIAEQRTWKSDESHRMDIASLVWLPLIIWVSSTVISLKRSFKAFDQTKFRLFFYQATFIVLSLHVWSDLDARQERFV